MKTSIIYLGVFALSIFTSCNAKNGFKGEFLSQNRQEVTNLFLGNNQNESVATAEESKVTLLKDNNATEELTTSNVTAAYKRSIEEVIAEDNLITESIDDESQIASFDESVLKVIAEDNKITECSASDEMIPLDFEFINQNAIPTVKVELGIINLDKSDIKY